MSVASLDDLGWSPAFADAFDVHTREGLEPARVVLEHTHIYRVAGAGGEQLARVSGRLRHHAASRSEFPAVGDWVAIDTRHAGEARIQAVLPRRSRFSRRAAGDVTEEQVVAANIDVVFLVNGLDRDFNVRRVERYLLTAWDSGARPIIVLNKADLVDDVRPFVEEIEPLAPGVPIVALSTRQAGTVEALRDFIGPGRTAALLGSSGVGKSSIANVLMGEERLRTREVRESDSRGRHTSTARELVLLPGGGVLIDTPGMRELQLWDTGESLAGAFADIETLAGSCRFRDCRHTTEPGCAVTAAVTDGTIPAVRLESFHKLRDEQAYQEVQQDVQARLAQKRRFKVLTKALEKRLKEKG